MEENIWISESSQEREFESKDSLAEMKEYLRKPVLLENLASGTEVCLRCGKNEWKLKWMIDGEETERMYANGMIILPIPSIPVCNFEIGVTAVPSKGDTIAFIEDDKRIGTFRILDVTAIHTGDEVSHYVCSFEEVKEEGGD